MYMKDKSKRAKTKFKKYTLLMLGLTLLYSGCGRQEDDIVGNDSHTPDWAKANEIEGELFQGLNLDGVGEADDEAYVSMYHFGDYYQRLIVIRIRLGTGKTLVEVFPGFRDLDYDFKTGKLFADDQEDIILSVQTGNSNYNATDLFILRVVPAETSPETGVTYDPYTWALLDTTALPDGRTLDILEGNGLSWPLGIKNKLTRDAEVVDLEGSSLQGLKITAVDPRTAPPGEVENVIYWENGLWNDGDRYYLGKWKFLKEWTPINESNTP